MMEKKLPEGWDVKQFLECIEKEASSNKLKILKSEFQNKGEYPIIDQGIEYIAGYTDNPLKVYKGELPVIIFGDHTRIFKFVDFPFSLGADGTKVLVPKKDLVYPKYFYFFLHRLKIESHGYSRHYKFLKEKQIVIPPLQTQKKIVLILEKAEETKKLRMQADELADRLLQSVFLEMFGDPVKNPKGWEVKNFGAEIKNIQYGTGSPPEYQKIGIPFIRATNIKKGTIQKAGLVYISKEGASKIKKCKVKMGDLIIVRSGVNTGDCALIPDEYESSYAAYDLIIQIPYPQNYYYNFVINSDYGKSIIRPLSRRTGQPHINAEQVKSLKFHSPPIQLLEKFAQITEKVEAMQQNQKQSQQEIDNLFNALMQKAFKGELTT